MNFRAIWAAALVLSAPPSYAAENMHYCVEEKTAGMAMIDGAFVPTWDEGEGGKRYTIHFNEDYTQLTGVQGGSTLYNCIKGYPTRAPDVVTCANSRMITTTFSYSMISGHFTFALNHPGSWLSIGTDRESFHPKSDVFIFGKCQKF